MFVFAAAFAVLAIPFAFAVWTAVRFRRNPAGVVITR